MARKQLPEPAREIDLHRLGVAAALKRLSHELVFCRARGISPVLVITGRGWHSEGGAPVLLPAVESWLRGPAGREHSVVEVKRTSKDGALWVQLARPEA